VHLLYPEVESSVVFWRTRRRTKETCKEPFLIFAIFATIITLCFARPESEDGVRKEVGVRLNNLLYIRVFAKVSASVIAGGRKERSKQYPRFVQFFLVISCEFLRVLE
jgi:hypothetical protein